MNTENYFRLEFSEKQQWLRLDTGKTPENTYGFRTICHRAKDSYLSAFIDYMDSKHNLLTAKPRKLTLETVINEFGEWKIAIECYEKRVKIHYGSNLINHI